MSSKFRKVKLGEILIFKTGKLDSNAAENNGAYPFFTCSPVTLSINSYAFDDEVVLLAGNNANGVFSVKYYNGKFNAYQRTYVISPIDNTEVNMRWLYFRIKHVTSELQQMSVGTATKFLTKKILDSFEIELPPLQEQAYQADILWSLQEKITNNEAINQTLEQMAQALFKSWFLDFEPVEAKVAVLEAGGSQEEATLAAMTAISGKDADSLIVFEKEHPEKFAELKATAKLFPSAMQDSELGEIPKGWCIKTYDQFCDFVQSGGTPKRSEPAYWENGCIKWLSSGEVRGKIVLDTKEKITDAGLNNSSAKLWPKHSTVMAMYGATAGEICLLAEDMSANQACCALHSINSPFFTYFSLCNISTEISSKASGSAQQNLNKGIISETKICIPNDNILSDYENKIHSIMMAWISNVKLSRGLSMLRNTLLPKLLSGEITLPEVEQAVSEAENV
ncbi:MAG: Restriction endonuclease subunit S [Rahnella inusitata]|jgi:type I restriction enzyme S subunit